MKNILYIFLLLLTAASCTKDFEEINRDPFSPTQTSVGPLFNNVVGGLQLGWNEQFYLHNERLYGVTQLGAKFAIGFDNVTIGTEEVWSKSYDALVHLREIEKRLDEAAAAEEEVDGEVLNNIRAQVKILLAYRMFRLTDLFGDVPFFAAGQGFQDLEALRVAFDPQEDIYKFLLAELKWAEENIRLPAEAISTNGFPYLTLGSFDNLFGNDMQHWRKFANSLRLRHALRMHDRDPGFAAPIIQDILQNNLPVIEEGEDVVMLPSAQDWRNEGVHWSFREHKKLRMGETIWSLLSENDSPDGSGIFDPRARIWFETNNDGDWAPFPQSPDANTPAEGGIPYQEHRDISYDVKGLDCIYSPFNYYLIRDDTDIPEILLTAAETNYIKAEAYLRGIGTPVDPSQAETEYILGIVSSMKFWQGIVENSEIWVNKPPLLSQSEIFAATNHPRLDIFNAEDKLELVQTQRFLDAFRQPWEAYALQRRLGGNTPTTGTPQVHSRFAYPPSEIENNPENYGAQLARMGEDSPAVKVWWAE